MGLTESWLEEKQSAWLYRTMQAVEQDSGRRELFSALADAAEFQASLWEEQIRKAGNTVPASFSPSLRIRIVASIVRVFGPRAVRPVLAAMKVRGLSVYGSTPVHGHHPMPRSVEDVGRRHQGVAGGNLRAAVFGVNDGLVSNTSLIMGVAGATTDLGIILTTGAAGLLAGALSMSAGEYVSVRSQRELYEYQIGLEAEELAEYPQEEAEELALIYHARGVPLDEARYLSGQIIQNPAHALDTLAREELGLNPDELGSPWRAALSSFGAFTGGAILPLLPFLLGLGSKALAIAAGIAAIALFSVGAALSLFTGRNALTSGLRMVLIGGGAGILTYALGHLLGVNVS